MDYLAIPGMIVTGIADINLLVSTGETIYPQLEADEQAAVNAVLTPAKQLGTDIKTALAKGLSLDAIAADVKALAADAGALVSGIEALIPQVISSGKAILAELATPVLKVKADIKALAPATSDAPAS